jgi:hypothetical protein
MSVCSIETNKVLWVIGALERLASLGLLEEPPVRVSPDHIDDFVELDDVRDCLFLDNKDIKEIIASLVREFNGTCDPCVVDGLNSLVLDYKDNRQKIMKYALNYIYNID